MIPVHSGPGQSQHRQHRLASRGRFGSTVRSQTQPHMRPEGLRLRIPNDGNHLAREFGAGSF